MNRVLANVLFGSLLFSLTAFATTARDGKTCGARGSIDERIADCATPVDQGGMGDAALRTYQNEAGEKFYWRLVTQTEKGSQVWRDETPIRANEYVVWADVAESTMHHWHATEFCDDQNRGSAAKGHLKLKFRLASGEEFLLSEQHGIRQVLPNIADRTFWAGDFISEAEALTFDSKDGTLSKANRGSGMVSVRCALVVKAE